MNRRTVLRWLGLAPVAAPAPAAVAAVSAPALPPIAYTALAADVTERMRVAFEPQRFVIEVRQDGTSRFVSPADAAHAEAWNSATSESEMIERIDHALASRFG
jgi:hypothetical protein